MYNNKKFNKICMMSFKSINITLKDKITDKILTNDKFIILNDEPLSIVKERLNYHYKEKYYPNFIKFSDMNGNTINKKSFFIDYNNSGNEEKIVFVEDISQYTILNNIFENIFKKYININPEIKELFKNDYNILSVEDFKQKYDFIYKIIIEEYTDLTINDFLYVVYHIYGNNSNNGDDVKDVIDYVNKKRDTCYKSLIKKYNEYEKNLYKFYKICANKLLRKEYYNDGLPPIVYKMVHVEFIPKKNKIPYVKIIDIFNKLQLSNIVPLIGIEKNDKKEPDIRIFNDISNDISARELKSWIVNEKKKVKIESYKKIKDLMVKLKREEVNGSEYITLNINDYGIIDVKIIFNEYDEYRYKSINDIIYNIKQNIKTFIDKITLLRPFNIDESAVIIKSLTCSCNINTKIHNNHFQNIILNETFKKYIFELKETKGISNIENEIEDIEEIEEIEDIYNLNDNDNINVDRNDNIGNLKDKLEISAYYKKNIYNSSERIRKPCHIDLNDNNADTDDTYTNGYTGGIYGDREKDIFKRGVNIQIKDNPYNIGSIVNIYAANSLNEIYMIIDQIISIDKLDERQEPLKQKLKDKKNDTKDNLRAAGINVTSKGCQGNKQITINHDNTLKPLEGSYELNYKKLRLVCLDNTYRYPGFTVNEGEVCCFQNDQRNTYTYTSNMGIPLYYPSNFMITIKLMDNNDNNRHVKDYNTILLKNNKNEFFYLDDKNQLIEITNDDVLNKINNVLSDAIKRNETIWLPKITFSELLQENSKCSLNPDFKNKNNDINSQCSHHKTNKFFGYTTSGYPCCFNKVQPVYKKFQYESYVLDYNKILETNKIGKLYPIFEDDFNNKMKTIISDISNGRFYRMGVTKNNTTFLNAISMCLLGYESSNYIKKSIIEYLNKNPNVFQSLNNGQISKYNTLNDYISKLKNKSSIIDMKDTIDILKHVYKINILVFDIPIIIDKSQHTIDENSIKIICNYNKNFKPYKDEKFIVLFKRNEYFDILIYYNIKETTKIRFLFDYTDSTLFQYLIDFYNLSCKKETIVPSKFYKQLNHTENTNYVDFINAGIIINALKDTPFKITEQIIDDDKKIHMIVSKHKILIPVKETTNINDIKTITISDIELIDANEYLNEIKQINDILKQKDINTIEITGITENKLGLVTHFIGYTIPIKKTDNTLYNLPILPYNYYATFQKSSTKQINGKVGSTKQNDGKVGATKQNDDQRLTVATKQNEQIQYSKSRDLVMYSIYKLKKQLAYIIHNSPELTKYIKKIQESDKYNTSNRFEVINLYTDTFVKIINEMKHKHNIILNNNMLYLSIIANEIIDDNVENLFINDIIKQSDETSELKHRDTETVVYNLDDFNTFIKNNFNLKFS